MAEITKTKTPYITPPREPDFVGEYPVIDRWMQRVSELLNQISDGIDVNIQDQTTELIDLHLTSYVDALDITVATAIDDTVVRVSSATTPTTAHMACFKEGTAFYQGEILSVAAVGGTVYDITLDTPLDFAFTTAGGCSLRNLNLAVDGSVTPVIFSVSPSKLDVDTSWDIVRVIFSFVGPAYGAPIVAPDDTSFGTQAPLTSGIVLRYVNGTTKNIFNTKTNADLKAHMYDLVYTSVNRASEYGVSCRRTFGGQSKNGVVIRLDNDAVPANADQLQVIVQDDLTAHTLIQVVAQGHIVDP